MLEQESDEAAAVQVNKSSSVISAWLHSRSNKKSARKWVPRLPSLHHHHPDGHGDDVLFHTVDSFMAKVPRLGKAQAMRILLASQSLSEEETRPSLLLYRRLFMGVLCRK